MLSSKKRIRKVAPMSEILELLRFPRQTWPRANESAPATEVSGARRKRIVIVGGGFAGVAAAQALKHCDVDVVLIDRRNHHIFQPLLYQVATAVLAPSDIAAPIRQLGEKQKNVSVLLGDVTAVDLNARSVDASCPAIGIRKIQFDYLVIAPGMRPSYFGHDEFARYAPGLKTLDNAEAIRSKILSAYEFADTTDDDRQRARHMTFVLVGAGPTGVELAASIAQLATATLRGQFRQIDPARSPIILIEGSRRILPTFAESLAKKAAIRLEKLGVKIVTGVKVDNVDQDGAVADGKRIPSATVLWTAGVAPAPLAALLGAETDRAGRVCVGPFLNIDDVAGVFVVGDASSVECNGRQVPAVAQAPIQQGRYVGRLISQQVKGREPRRPFQYFDKGNMAVVGKSFAILESGWLRTSGRMTWLVWVILHLISLPQLQNRLRVQIQWFWSYCIGQRSSRLIPEVQRAGSQMRRM
jgi:NADH:ubiquinone reductase (H+-translocating)